MAKRTTILRCSSALIFGCAVALITVTERKANEESFSLGAYSPNDETLTEDACMGWDENFDQIAFDAQIDACSALVDGSEGDVALFYTNMRALAYLHNGHTRAHSERALVDLNAVISAGQGGAQAYANRGKLLVRLNEDIVAAHSDFDRAIALTEDQPRARYFLLRSLARGVLYETGADPDGLRKAMEDVKMVLSVEPDNQQAIEHRRWIVHQHRENTRAKGGDISRG